MKNNLNPFIVTIVAQALRYLIIAGAAYLLFYIWKRKAWFHRKIQQRFPTNKEMLREVAYSCVTMLIFGAFGWAVFQLKQAGYTQIYANLSDHSGAYTFLSLGLLIFFHDTWFYWTHRLMHQPRIFPIFHRVHHLSHNPSPWAAFAFHPLEAVVEAAFFPIAVFLFPLHGLTIVLFMFFMMILNVMGHTGFEYAPKGFTRHAFWKWFNTPTHHNMHHHYTKGNFGLYFNIWDRLMGTNHKHYDREFEEVLNREKEVTANKSNTEMAVEERF